MSVKRILLGVLVMTVAAYLLALDPLRGGFGFVFGWLLLAYLVMRALPGIRADLGRLRGHRPARLGRYRGSIL